MAGRNIEDEIIELVASGEADTRARLVAVTGLAQSTVSSAVVRLLAEGSLKESDSSVATGGRRARRLEIPTTEGAIGLVELGAHHALCVLADDLRRGIEPESISIDIFDGPETVLDAVIGALEERAVATGAELVALGIAVPAPVGAESGMIVRPARMPGWDGCRIADLVRERFGLLVHVENDARAGAMGERAYRVHSCAPAVFSEYLYIKAGSAIGGAFVHEGSVMVGAQGIAGDLSHVPVPAGASRPCGCGNLGCLATIASAEAIRGDLNAAGFSLASNAELLEAASKGDPEVVTLIRASGVLVGESAAHLVSFLNPEAVVIGGALSAVDAFTAGVRQALHQGCLPAIVEDLVVDKSRVGRAAALWGLLQPTSSLVTKEFVK